MSGQYFLKSKRIGFRTWSLHDIELAIDLWQDHEVTKYIGGPQSVSKIHKRLATEKTLSRIYNIQYWPIFLLKTGEHVGCCGLRPYDSNEKVFELGFHIKSSLWGNGYAKEAAKTVIKHAFTELDAKGLYAGHHPENHVSKGLLQKLGFEYTHEEYHEPTGLHHPSYLLSK